MERRVTLSGNRMPTKEAMHTYLARKLKFPSYYGKNLDALHDCLCEISHPLHITVTFTNRLTEALGDYGETFLEVLKDSTEENKNITLSVYTDKRI
ncbi:MAG: barstar family protein [Lachnospiraceae bacterium]|nr:barstar family protein [Lachnospiraceae bacterium]